MKKIAIIFTAILWMLILLPLQGCTFFYGESTNASYTEMFDSLWKDYNETYALFDVRGINWNEQYAKCRPLVYDEMSDLEFFQVLQKLLYPLNDAHVYVKTPYGSLNAGEDNAPLDVFSLDAVCKQYIENPKKCGNNIITYGTLKSDNSIGYIHVASFSSGQTGVNQNQNWATEIDIALMELINTRCLILDIRGNRGGLTGNVSQISGRFCLQNKAYAISRTKNGPGPFDFGPGVELEIKRNGSMLYVNPVILLTNAQTMSAGEEFAMAMTSQPQVTQVGNHTCGVFSLSLERCLVNGWKYSVSVQKVTDPFGNIPEGKGIVPSPENLIVNKSLDQDLQMMRAIELCK